MPFPFTRSLPAARGPGTGSPDADPARVCGSPAPSCSRATARKGVARPARDFNVNPHELPKGADVAPVVARFINRRFKNKWAAREKRMIQDAVKSFEADFAFANVLVAVGMRVERSLRIVRVDDEDGVESNGSVNFLERPLEPRRAAQIVAGFK